MFAILEDALTNWPIGEEMANPNEMDAEEGEEQREDEDIIDEGDGDDQTEVEELHESSERNDYITNKRNINDQQVEGNCGEDGSIDIGDNDDSETRVDIGGK